MEKDSREAVSFSLSLANCLQFVAIYFILIMNKTKKQNKKQNKKTCKIAFPHNPQWEQLLSEFSYQLTPALLILFHKTCFLNRHIFNMLLAPCTSLQFPVTHSTRQIHFDRSVASLFSFPYLFHS